MSLFDDSETITLVDFSPMVHRCQVGSPASINIEQHWRWIFLNSLRKLFREWKNIFFVLDTSPTRKRKLDKKYKASRQTNEIPPIWSAVDPILKCLPAPYLWVNGEEADDVLAAVACTKLTENWEVGILSLDRDLWQLSSRARVYDFRLKALVTEQHCRDIFGCHPSQIPLFKTWLGDSGDEVPCVPRVKKSLLQSLLVGPFLTLEQSLSYLDSARAKRELGTAYKVIKDFVPQAKKNWALVKLKESFPSLNCELVTGKPNVLLEEIGITANVRNVAEEVGRFAEQNLVSTKKLVGKLGKVNKIKSPFQNIGE